MSVESGQRVCVRSMRSRTASTESRPNSEGWAVCEGGQQQVSLYNEQEKPDSEQRI